MVYGGILSNLGLTNSYDYNTQIKIGITGNDACILSPIYLRDFIPSEIKTLTPIPVKATSDPTGIILTIMGGRIGVPAPPKGQGYLQIALDIYG